MRTNFINVLIGILILPFGQCFSQNKNLNQVDDNGKRHGKWQKTYESTGNLRYTGQFEHGEEVGTFKFYTEENPDYPKATKTYPDDREVVILKYFNKKGKLKSEGEMKNRKRVGTWTYYFAESGKTMMTEDYSNDKLDGWKKVYYKNGQLTEKQQFENGVAEGEKQMFAEDGTLLQEYTYRNGRLNGPSKIYSKSGELLESGNYKKGRRDGKWKFYENGNLKTTKYYPLKDPAEERRTGEPDVYKEGGKPDTPDHLKN